MQYRKLGSRVAEEVSALGFGCMRFPTLEDGKEIDREKAMAMLDYALENGVNYFDTAYPYHGGASETLVGDFLAQDGRRDRVMLATKMPMWSVKEAEDLDRLFDEQLEKLRTDRIDFYLLHALSSERWELALKVNALEWGERQKAAGRIRYFGFSFHDDFSVFQKIAEGYADWDFCQIQYNYMNETVQAGTAGLALAASRGMGVVVMEPLLGGALATPPEEVTGAFAGDGAEKRTPVEAALRWLWDKEDVGTVLSGMSTMDQVRENVVYASRSSVSCLAETERPLYRAAQDVFDELRPVPCTSCQYCMPCPNGVDIPGNFAIFNDFYMFKNEGQAKWRYNQGMSEDKRASACVACGECEPKCPQQIPIIDSLERVDRELKREESA